MKHLNKLFVAVMMVMGLSSQAQDSNNPWAIAFGANAVLGLLVVGGAVFQGTAFLGLVEGCCLEVVLGLVPLLFKILPVSTL